jgi:AcrR family transcriptional regulator
VPRPRTHDLDSLLDVAEQIAGAAGPAGLTLRRLAAVASVSNGSIYHAFSSKEELLARVWARAARLLLTLQNARVEAALANRVADEASAIEAVAAVAVAPVDFAIDHPAAARLFFMQRRDQLVAQNLPAPVADELEAIQADFTRLLIRLAQARWARHDRIAVEAIATCVVDLPGGLMHRKLLTGIQVDSQAKAQIDTACRAILGLELPAPPTRPS